jgi:hypothetical protein
MPYPRDPGPQRAQKWAFLNRRKDFGEFMVFSLISSVINFFPWVLFFHGGGISYGLWVLFSVFYGLYFFIVVVL